MDAIKTISKLKTNFVAGWLFLFVGTFLVYLYARVSHMWIGTPQSKTFLHFASMPIVVMVLPAAILLPGFVVSAFIEAKGLLKRVPDGSMFVFSIIFFIVQYLIFDVILIRVFEVKVPNELFTAGYFLTLAGLIYAAGTKKTCGIVADIIQRNRGSLIAYVITIATCATIVSSVAKDPFHKFRWQNISYSNLTYKTWKSHDNYFQYINGKIIANEKDTFAYHYRNRRLVYEPQDRVMGSAVVWSVIMRTFNTTHFMTYTLMGICLNAFLIFPLFILGRDYLKTPYMPIFLATIIASPFFLIHIYFTWFKFTGAAFFIFGLLMLLKNRNSWKHWVACGACWGIGANLHASAALGYPLFVLLFYYLAAKETNWKQSLKLPVLLFATFVLLMLPWLLVKSHLFPPRAAILVNQHFLHGHASVGSFLNAYPLETQLPYRLGRLWMTLRFETIGELFSAEYTASVIDFVKRWTAIEVLYISFALYPLAFFAFIGHLGTRKVKSHNFKSFKEKFLSLNGLIGIIALCSIVALVFSKHARWQPDYSIETSLGVIIVLQACLLSSALKGSSWINKVLVLYVGFSVMRIFTLLTA